MGLCERGARDLSDEIADVALSDATVRGFTRRIALRHGSWPLVQHLEPNSPPQVAMFMDDVWFVVPPDVVDHTTIDAIVFPLYDEHAHDRIESISATEAAAIIGDQAPN